LYNWRELEERAMVAQDEADYDLNEEERIRLELIEELDENRPALRRRVASALIRLGEKIDPPALAETR
jgi:hypothetical protein